MSGTLTWPTIMLADAYVKFAVSRRLAVQTGSRFRAAVSDVEPPASLPVYRPSAGERAVGWRTDLVGIRHLVPAATTRTNVSPSCSVPRGAKLTVTLGGPTRGRPLIRHPGKSCRGVVPRERVAPAPRQRLPARVLVGVRATIRRPCRYARLVDSRDGRGRNSPVWTCEAARQLHPVRVGAERRRARGLGLAVHRLACKPEHGYDEYPVGGEGDAVVRLELESNL